MMGDSIIVKYHRFQRVVFDGKLGSLDKPSNICDDHHMICWSIDFDDGKRHASACENEIQPSP